MCEMQGSQSCQLKTYQKEHSMSPTKKVSGVAQCNFLMLKTIIMQSNLVLEMIKNLQLWQPPMTNQCLCSVFF